MRAGRVWLAVVAAGIATVASAETGRAILDRAKALDEGERRWTDRQQRLKLTITGGIGGERTRELTLTEKKSPGGDPHHRQLVVFRAPPEVKGTAFLAWQHRGRPAEQWLYLPELKRVRQIVAKLRNESFVGTDLAYKDMDIIADLTSWTDADATVTLLGDDTADGVACHKIELRPQREDIGYPRLVVSLAKTDLVARVLEFHDDQGIRKTLHQSKVETVGAIPVGKSIRVQTPSAGTTTTIDVQAVAFDQGLSDDRFTQAALDAAGE